MKLINLHVLVERGLMGSKTGTRYVFYLSGGCCRKKVKTLTKQLSSICSKRQVTNRENLKFCVCVGCFCSNCQV
jgi:hypothetical protein